MTQDRAAHEDQNWRIFTGPKASTHYTLLGLTPSASVQEIRRAYRELSKLYHPDTTDLPATIATQKFQQLNEAYVTLSSPERRLTYDQKIGFSRIHVIQSPDLPSTVSQVRVNSSSYLGTNVGRRPVEDFRPLSPGELFALFILGVTFLACLVLAIAVGLTRGETIFQPFLSSSPVIVQPAATPLGENLERQLPSIEHQGSRDDSGVQPVVSPSSDPPSDEQSAENEQLPSADQTQDNANNADLSDPA